MCFDLNIILLFFPTQHPRPTIYGNVNLPLISERWGLIWSSLGGKHFRDCPFTYQAPERSLVGVTSPKPLWITCNFPQTVRQVNYVGARHNLTQRAALSAVRAKCSSDKHETNVSSHEKHVKYVRMLTLTRLRTHSWALLTVALRLTTSMQRDLVE